MARNVIREPWFEETHHGGSVTVTETSGMRIFDPEGREICAIAPNAALFQRLSVELGQVALSLARKGT